MRKIRVFRHLISLLIFSMPVFSAGAQTEGTIRYLCLSNWSKMLSSVDYISKQQRERNEYVWGSRSESKEYTRLYFNTDMSKYENSEEIAEDEYYGWSSRQKTYFLSYNFTNRTLYHVLPLMGKSYIVDDSLRVPAWKIKNDMKEIAGHICMNAGTTDTLRNQVIEAWFALDIPVSSGPERFIGLPGLILEININDGAYVMTADKIEFRTLTSELTIPPKLKGKKTDYPGLQEIFKKKIDECRKDEEPWFYWLPF